MLKAVHYWQQLICEMSFKTAYKLMSLPKEYLTECTV